MLRPVALLMMTAVALQAPRFAPLTPLTSVHTALAHRAAWRACRFYALLSPGARAKVRTSVRPTLDELAEHSGRGDLEALAQRFPGHGKAGEEALALIVVMEACQKSDADLRDIMQVERTARQKEALRNRSDTGSETSELVQLRLQMLGDQRSKVMETLSNLMKKTSDTSDALLGNLK